MNKTRQILAAEVSSFSSTGLSAIEDKAYQARLIANDLVLANEAARVWPATSDLEVCRRHLAAREYAAAREVIQKHLSSSIHPSESGEWHLESSRLAFHLGDFQPAVDAATFCIQISPHAPSRISALIIRANASFELGLFQQVKKDLRECRGLLNLYPQHPGRSYCRTLHIRLTARLHGVTEAQRELEVFQRFLQSEGQLDLDALHVYLRVQNDLMRLSEKGPDLATASATVAVAETIGDELYRALDLLDLWVAAGADTTSDLFVEINSLAEAHPRVRMLRDEVLGTAPPRTTTGSALRQSLLRKSQTLPGQAMAGDIIASVGSGFVIHFRSGEFRSLEAMPTLLALFRFFREMSLVPKDMVFQALNPRAEFNKLDHDGTVRNLVSRFRKATGLEIISDNANLRLQQSVLFIP